MNKEPFYAAKCLYRHDQLEPIESKSFVYEERIILIQADDFDSAMKKAEKEAREYADSGTVYLEYLNVFHLYEYILHNGSELYSEMRSSDLESDEYISKFYDTGCEHSQ
ncbi:DUF4288 domain-containing protein [Saccharophagus degradans]|uniref:DUF4288 domain-containing protein n=1 Tax=Saccharophagus degradans TaxID=86304 RepID=UPI001C084B41|nr:DUF4288 domain-containing protein [Saccharophagus degradans]MBU2985186.1 DUF4288 domain-containing protein [Saccharophagus degradans]